LIYKCNSGSLHEGLEMLPSQMAAHFERA